MPIVVANNWYILQCLYQMPILGYNCLVLESQADILLHIYTRHVVEIHYFSTSLIGVQALRNRNLFAIIAIDISRVCVLNRMLCISKYIKHNIITNTGYTMKIITVLAPRHITPASSSWWQWKSIEFAVQSVNLNSFPSQATSSMVYGALTHFKSGHSESRCSWHKNKKEVSYRKIAAQSEKHHNVILNIAFCFAEVAKYNILQDNGPH